MDNKEEILANFQAITGEVDLAKSLCLLESCNWDLGTAVTNFSSDPNMANEDVEIESNSTHYVNDEADTLPAYLYSRLSYFQSTAASTSKTFSTLLIDSMRLQFPHLIGNASSSQFLQSLQSNTSNHFPMTSWSNMPEPSARVLTFYVQYNDIVFSVQINDSETVGKLRELLSFTIGEGFHPNSIKFTQGALCDKSIQVILRDLELPLENTLMITVDKDASNVEDESQQDSREDEFFNAREVLSSTPCRSDLVNVPLHSDTSVVDLGSSSTDRSKADIHKRPVSDGRPSNLTVLPSDSDDFYPTQTEDEISFICEEPKAVKRQKLMDPNMEGVQQSIQQFCSVFFTRYLDGDPKKDVYGASVPPFHVDTLPDVAQATVFAPPSTRKPLLLYLHKDDCLASHLFPLQVLCNQKFCDYLVAHGLAIWPWDLTCTVNRTRFFSTLSNTFDHHISHQIASLEGSRYPLLILLLKVQSRIEIALIFHGEELDVDNNLLQLESVVEDYRARMALLIQEEVEMRQRELIREEQDKAYEETKRIDELLEEKKRLEKEAQKIKEAKKMEREIAAANERQMKIDLAKSLLISEPDVKLYAKTDLAHLRFRISDESGVRTISRYFHADNNLAHLIAFVESQGYLQEEYKMLTTFPRRDLSSECDKSITLRQLKLVPQETITLEKL